MGKRVYNAKIILEGACYDATRLLYNGQVREAAALLSRRLDYIKGMEHSEYMKVEWD